MQCGSLRCRPTLEVRRGRAISEGRGRQLRERDGSRETSCPYFHHPAPHRPPEGNGVGRGAIGTAAGMVDVIGTGTSGGADFRAGAAFFAAFAFVTAGFLRDTALSFFLRAGAALLLVLLLALLLAALAFFFFDLPLPRMVRLSFLPSLSAMIVLPIVWPPTENYAAVATRPCNTSGTGPPVAQSISSTGCTTGIAVPAAICVMQPMLPAAIRSAPTLSICPILRARNRSAMSGCRML